MAGWMEHASTGISHMSHDINHIERIHELDCCFAVTLQSECDNTAGAIWHVLLGKIIIFIALQSAIVNPSHTLIVLQEFCYLLCILAMLTHTEMETLKT